LPFLRFTRDKRGYETTSLVYASRQRGRARQRILYWFRTPPGVKVGRPALDEEAIRWIEEHNPDIEFNWQKILEAQPPPAPPPDDGRNRRKSERSGRDARDGRDGRSGRPNRRREDQPPSRPAASPPPPSSNAPAVVVDSEAAELHVPALSSAWVEEEQTSFEDVPREDASPLDDVPPGEDAAASEDMPAIEALEQLTHPDAEELPPAAGPPIESIVGKEQLIRLRARYAELQARITERGGEAARVEELRAKAGTLNPDTWVTEEEARAGLQEFDVRIRDLRLALGLRPRRRSRRGGRRRRRGGQSGQGGQRGQAVSSASDQQPGSGEAAASDRAAGPPETPNSEDFSD
jgi:hypothetical protein